MDEGYRAAYRRIGDIERTYQQLLAIGLAPEHLNLKVRDEEQEEPPAEVRRANRWFSLGEAIGMIVGLLLGVGLLMPSKGASSLEHIPLFIALLVLGTWALCGALLGAMLGALGSEVFAPNREGSLDFELEVRPPLALNSQVLAILSQAPILERLEPVRVPIVR